MGRTNEDLANISLSIEGSREASLPSPGACLVVRMVNGRVFEAPLPNANFVDGLCYDYGVFVHQDGIDIYPIHIAQEEDDDQAPQTVGPNPISYQVGDYYPQPQDPATAIGVVYWLRPGSRGMSGKILSLDSAEKAWSRHNTKAIHAVSLFSGHINLNAVLAADPAQQDFPAFLHCALKGPGWYLPSLNELQILNEQWDKHATQINGALTSARGYAFCKEDCYWSSTEDIRNPSCKAECYHFGSKIPSSADKSAEIKTRAIKVF